MMLFTFLFICLALANAQPYFTQESFGFFGAGNNQYQFFHCLDGSGSGNIFATGSTDGTNLGQNTATSGSYDMFIAKYSKNNGFLTSNANNPILRFLTTPQNEVGTGCVSDTSGSVYAVGYTQGSIARTNNGQLDTLIVKYDSQMNRVWTVQFDVTSNGYPDFATQVLLVGNQLLVVGQFYIPGNVYNTFFLKLDPSSGSVIMSPRLYPISTTSTQVLPQGVSIDPNTNNIIITGIFQSQNLASGLNATGGVVPALTNQGSYDGWVAAFTPSGSLIWQTGFGSAGTDYLLGIVVDVTGSIFVSGCMTGIVYSSPYNPTNPNSCEPFMAKLNSAGIVQWTNSIPKSDSYSISRLVVDNLGGVFGLLVSNGCIYASYGYGTSTCYYLSQTINLVKFDTNGAIQYNVPISNGIPMSFTLDNSGLLTIGSTFNGANIGNLHGVTPTFNNVYNGVIDQQLLSYNCSCGNLASLVQQMSTLLNIVPA